MTASDLQAALLALMAADREASAEQRALEERIAKLRPESRYQRMVKRDLEERIDALQQAIREIHRDKMELLLAFSSAAA